MIETKFCEGATTFPPPDWNIIFLSRGGFLFTRWHDFEARVTGIDGGDREVRGSSPA